jgi:hypothetical protein
MTGFQHTTVSHMYGNKRFSMVKAEMSISDRGEVVVRLLSKQLKVKKAPVCFTLAAADAIRLGEGLLEIGEQECRNLLEVRELCGISM